MAGLGRQAKTLTEPQIRALLAHVRDETRDPRRNRVVVLLSFKAGLRVKEIAGLRWKHVTDAEGALADGIALDNETSKGRSGRPIWIHEDLRDALLAIRPETVDPKAFVVRLTANYDNVKSRTNSVRFLFRFWFKQLGFHGASSHSGRRTFITAAARAVSSVGGSLRDVQDLAGHVNLATTQRYIDANPEAQRALIGRL